MRDACLKLPTQERLVLMATYTVMALGLTAAVIGNRNFGQEKVRFQVGWMIVHVISSYRMSAYHVPCHIILSHLNMIMMCIIPMIRLISFVNPKLVCLRSPILLVNVWVIYH